MYNEENENKNNFFRNLIVKILLVLLFVFLLMWLFPMPNLSPFYDKIFAANINTMTDAAKNYFTTARLPEKEGETKTLTLQEMIDNKMIVSFTDSDGKACDTNKSYVEVTKEDGEYIFKTNLSCPTEEDYVITYFGCYDVCEDNSCKIEEEDDDTPATKKVIEYQFYKETKTSLIDKYVCKDGYTLSGTKCVLKLNVEKEEDATLSCSKGYTYNELTEKCEKSVREYKKPNKSCPTGYELPVDKTKCIKENTTTEDAEYTYKCSDNSIPVDGKCPLVYRTEVPAEASYSCPTGYELSEDKTECTLETDAKVTYTCPSGITPVDGKCPVYKTTTIAGTCVKTIDNCSYVTYTYAVGYADTDTYIRTFSKMSGSLYIYKVCIYSKTCSGTTYKQELVSNDPATANYYCTSGDRVGTKCISKANSEVSYSCKAGTMSSDGDTCLISSVSSVDAYKVYKCSVGTLNGDKCIIGSTSIKTPILSCEYGTLKNGKCVITVSEKQNPTYSCRTGYTLVGDSCYKFSTTTKTMDAEIIYKTTSTKAYKWSRSKTLSGWTFTGKTRTVTVSA